MPGERIHLVFRLLAAATVVAAFAQVTLGGIVRVTGSGLGCPDWPLCHGRIIPPFEYSVLIEYSHRLFASSLGALMLGLLVLTWVYFRSNRLLLISTVVGSLMIVIAAILGGITVLTELSWWVRLLHLGIAQVVVASAVVVAIVSWKYIKPNYGVLAEYRSMKGSGAFKYWVISGVIGTFLLILFGSYIVGIGAGTSCSTWPLCRGAIFPGGEMYTLHMIHRYIALIVGVILLMISVVAKFNLSEQSGIVRVSFLSNVIMLAQVLFGAVMIWAEFPSYLKAMHLSMATLLWISLILLATLVYMASPGRFQEEGRSCTDGVRC